jgi:hypothetical protein
VQETRVQLVRLIAMEIESSGFRTDKRFYAPGDLKNDGYTVRTRVALGGSRLGRTTSRILFATDRPK